MELIDLVRRAQAGDSQAVHDVFAVYRFSEKIRLSAPYPAHCGRSFVPWLASSHGRNQAI